MMAYLYLLLFPPSPGPSPAPRMYRKGLASKTNLSQMWHLRVLTHAITGFCTASTTF